MRLSLYLSKPAFLIAGLLFLITLLLYIFTLAPSVVTIFDDSLEFHLVTYQLGIAHPTGYPLYTILGKFFTLLPVGNIAFRVNLMSAVFGGLTVALLYLVILSIAASTDASNQKVWSLHSGAAFGALLLAVSLVFWQQATVAEVYTLNAFFIVLLLLLTVWLPWVKSQKQPRLFFYLTFLAGLSLTHHRTMVLLFPAIAIYLFFTCRSTIFTPKSLIIGAIWAIAPLLLYLYLPLRGHIGSLDGTYENSWAGFWRQVTASGYSLFIFDNPFGHERDTNFFANLLSSQFYTIIPGLIGLIALVWQNRQHLITLLTLAFVTYFGFNAFYQVSDIEVFFIPNFLLWAIWSGLGITFLLRLVLQLRQPIAQRLLVALVMTGCTVMITRTIQINAPVVTQAYNWKVHDYGLDILKQPYPENQSIALVGILGEMTLVRYFQQTEELRPDIETVTADLENDRLAAVERLLAEGKQVYLTRELPNAPARWSLNAVGPLIRVDSSPVIEAPPISIPLQQSITPEINFLGYNIGYPSHTGEGAPPIRLTLFWQANTSVPADLKVSARLLDENGEAVTVVDAIPVHFAYPTTAWRPGEIVSDVYDLGLPADTPAGNYKPLIIWYDPAQNAAEVGRVELGVIEIN
ncbi:MAG: DUF2723 domain-containing protein [Chloroflexota bacterium]